MTDAINSNLQKTSAADPIYGAVKRDILLGKMPPGTPLRQDEIASDHGVSKIPVREALRRLEVEGLVVFERNKGARVRQFTEQDILHLMDIRIALECRAVELAVEHMIRSDISAMRTLLDEYAETADIAQSSTMNAAFHRMLYEPCGNTHLLDMISDLQQKVGPHLRLLVTEASTLERTVDEHSQILAACEAQDGRAAAALLRHHIETTKKEVAAYMRRRK